MSMKINFDMANNPEYPTLILAYKNGRKIGKIVADGIVVRDSMINPSEISFRVRKFLNGEKNTLWDKIVDFKLVWYKEADLWFEIYVELDESNETIKNVSCKQLGQAELSQIKLYNTEINTENDIARDDYLIPTVLYNPEHSEASLLHRIMEKAPHYSVIHVDSTIANIQRTFTFDDKSITDAFREIAEEVGCLFIFHSNSDANGKIQRAISVYDLESNCNACGHRGEFTSVCPECGSHNINEGYGEDTTIFVTSDELANDIKFVSDVDSIKNCFKLEAGDDLMTATVRNCNPNGTDYIWYISDDVKADMSKELVEKLQSYDVLYKTCQDDYIVNVDSFILKKYNDLAYKYQNYNKDLQGITTPIKGYPSLMMAVYNTIDLLLYLESGLMPNVEMSDTNASEQAALLTSDNISPVAVTDVSKISLATANSVVLSMAKVIADSRYRVKVNTSSLEGQIWTGNFIVTNYSDEEDTATSALITVTINDNYESFVQQKLDKTIKDKDEDNLSITGLFKMDYVSFCDELKKYSLNSLTSFHDACQACIDILIEQGVADSETWADSEDSLYDNLYTPYYQKLNAIEAEMKVRQGEINIITGSYDSDGTLVQNGLQPYLDNAKEEIQNLLDFQNYIGNELWLELCSYRREDKYSNENYISDGLTNSELFEKALEFIKVAKNEIFKSAELQHSISSGLKNLLVMKKFRPLIKYFETGNWIRIMVDDKVYKLRLLEYEIDFDNIDSLTVEFSDVLKTANGETDQKSIMSKITSITSSYNSVQRQASQGSKGNEIVQQWNESGLDATNTRIIGGAGNQEQSWDSHGMLFRKYDPITNTYDDEQLKIIHSTMAITTDNWETTKTAIGAYYYVDPISKKVTKAYGVNAEVIVGQLIIGEQLGIYNDNEQLKFDENGLEVSNANNSVIVSINPNNDSVFNIKSNNENVFSFKEGNLKIVGDIIAKSLTLTEGVKIGKENIDTTEFATVAVSGSYDDLINVPAFSTVATSGKYSDLIDAPKFASVATSGDYNDLNNTPTLSTVATSGKYSDLIGSPEIQTVINSNSSLPVCGKAVYDFALSKKQDVSNAEKLLYVDTSGNITSISVDELKTLLGV